MRVFHLTFVALWLALIGGARELHAAEDCVRDVDCRGDLICVGRRCVERVGVDEETSTSSENSGPPDRGAGAASATETGSAEGRPSSTAPEMGALVIASTATGEVRLDGEVVGMAPTTIDGVAPGSYDLRVAWEKYGGEERRTVTVQPGYATKVFLEPSAARIAGGHRRGLRFGVGGGAGALTPDPEGVTSLDGFGQLNAFANFGLVPAVDLRGAVDVWLGSSFGSTRPGSRHGEPEEPAFFLGVAVPLRVRFNLRSIYSIAVGGMVGFYTLQDRFFHVDVNRDGDYTGHRPVSRWVLEPMFGPTVSFLTLRMGSKRQFEVALDTSLLMMGTVIDSNNGCPAGGGADPDCEDDVTDEYLFMPRLLSTLTVSYLFLPDL